MVRVLATFFENLKLGAKQCYQNGIGQKLLENAKIQRFKMRHFG